MGDPVIVEGRWAVEALLDSPLFVARRIFLETGRHGDLVSRAGVPVVELSAEEISRRAGYDFHRGVYAEADRPEAREPDAEFLTTSKRLVIPVTIADPGNLGTIVRSAAAFGADGILIERGKGADIYSRIAIRASARAIFRLPVFECARLIDQLARLKSEGFSVIATALGPDTVPLTEVRCPEKCALLFGTEKEGLPPEILECCDHSIRIPMRNGMDSLNVAASAAVVMWELFGKH